MAELIKESSKVADVAYVGPPRGLVLVVATAAGVGYAPVAPGSFGAAVGVLLFIPLSTLHPALFAVTVIGLLALGIWAAEHAEHAFGQHDDGRIVIDEVVGQLITLSPLAFSLMPAITSHTAAQSLPLLAAGFVAFRLFDIWKPGPVLWAEKNFAGGAGVMFDDVVAGVLGAMALIPIALLVAGSPS
jgi:phosphatidylglycerophosphatase A